MHQISEQRTRKELIDPALEKAGWYLSNHTLIKTEIPVDGYDATPLNGVTDYSLYRPNGEVIAVVEAKKTCIDPKAAHQQAEHYVTEIAKHQSFPPFAFLTNGNEIFFFEPGKSPKRLIAGFFTPEDLERMLQIRQSGVSLNKITINSHIVERPYQHEAIRRLSEAFEKGKRKALLVMATGTGKTRTSMALIDLFMRANRARNILFVADRDVLVEQARTDGFKAFLPNEPCTRLHSFDIDKTNRLYVSTLQTLSICFEQFSPAFFDLIIFDEVHRSIFNKFNEVLEYFDGLQIGLTATPADFISRDTFLAFHCDDNKPTFLYTYDQAIKDGFLVDYELYAAQTKFQRAGIKGVDLSEEERAALVEKGIDPDDLDFTGSDLEKNVSNRDTIRKQWEEIMERIYHDQSGQLPGKTIIFAITQEHALRLEEVFNEMYPQFPSLARVITCKTEYRGQLMDAFKKADMPRIAISVDMLDTGVDIPEVTNLVFMKPIQSRIKLDQMIGRGTRPQAACRMFQLLPNGHKDKFLIMDFWENNFSKSATEPPDLTTPVLVTIFNTRLKLLEHFLKTPKAPEIPEVILELRSMIARLPRDSFSIKKVLPEIELVFTDVFWEYMVVSKLEFLRLKVAPLLRLVPEVDVAAETFVSKIERLKLQLALNKDSSQTIQSVMEDVAVLPPFVLEDPELKAILEKIKPDKLKKATHHELSFLAQKLAPQMKFKRRPDSFLLLDIRDTIEQSGYILLVQSGEKVYVKEYRERVEGKILEMVKNHPTIQAIARGETVDDFQLLELERTLHLELGVDHIELSTENIRKAYGFQANSFLDFIRTVLEMDNFPDYPQVVEHQFQRFISDHNFNADQIRFLRAVKSVFIQKRSLAVADLYSPPLTNFGSDAIDRWFTSKEVQEILSLTKALSME